MKVLDERRAAAFESIAEALVPGSSRVGPAVYVDAVLARAPAPEREAALAAIDALTGADLRPHAGTPAFLQLRALAIEAFYSDFVAPGRDAEGAWAEIDFAPPAAARLAKDWSYLGIAG